MMKKYNKTKLDFLRTLTKPLFMFPPVVNKLLFLFSIVLVLNSCDDGEKPIYGTNISASINVFLKDKNGNDILDTDRYPENRIRVNYFVGGKEVSYGYDTPGAFLDNPRGFIIGTLSEKEAAKGMHVFLNLDSSEEYPITYIHWNETETDTLKAHYARSRSSVVLDKLWIYENKEWKELSVVYFTIVK